MSLQCINITALMSIHTDAVIRSNYVKEWSTYGNDKYYQKSVGPHVVFHKCKTVVLELIIKMLLL